jgi:hypothetical protein
MNSKTVIAASGSTYVCFCRQLSRLRGNSEFPVSHDSGRQPKTYVKPEVSITVFELLMMSVVSLETCWAIKKHWNNKFYYTVASCWFFLYNLYYDARIHEHQTSLWLNIICGMQNVERNPFFVSNSIMREEALLQHGRAIFWKQSVYHH